MFEGGCIYDKDMMHYEAFEIMRKFYSFEKAYGYLDYLDYLKNSGSIIFLNATIDNDYMGIFMVPNEVSPEQIAIINNWPIAKFSIFVNNELDIKKDFNMETYMKTKKK